MNTFTRLGALALAATTLTSCSDFLNEEDALKMNHPGRSVDLSKEVSVLHHTVQTDVKNVLETLPTNTFTPQELQNISEAITTGQKNMLDYIQRKNLRGVDMKDPYVMRIEVPRTKTYIRIAAVYRIHRDEFLFNINSQLSKNITEEQSVQLNNLLAEKPSELHTLIQKRREQNILVQKNND